MKAWRCAGSLKTDESRTITEADNAQLQPQARQAKFSFANPPPSASSGNGSSGSTGGGGLGAFATKFSKKGTIQLPSQVPLH